MNLNKRGGQVQHTSKSRKQCMGNFCPLKNPNCEQCQIDEALDILEDFLHSREHNQKTTIDIPIN